MLVIPYSKTLYKGAFSGRFYTVPVLCGIGHSPVACCINKYSPNVIPRFTVVCGFVTSHAVLLTVTGRRFDDAVLYPPNGEKLTVWWRGTLSSSPWQVDGLMTSHAVFLTETEWRFGYATHWPPNSERGTVWWRRTLSPDSERVTVWWRRTLSS